MKHDNRTGRPAMAVKTMIAGVALSALLGFSINAQAQTCTIANWQGGATGLTNADAGTQGTDNRRYGGPCGLRVDMGPTARFVTDNSPAAESTYIARFYAFLDNAGTDPVILFEDSGENVQVWYNVPSAGDISLQVFDNADNGHLVTFSGVGSGWHSIEFAWEAAANADIQFSVNGADDETTDNPIDTSGIALTAVSLGNINGAGAASNSIDFDDFDSRRISRPGRLLQCDANDDGLVNILDALAILDEIGSAEILALGQPDCTENGAVDILDALEVLDLISG